MESAWWQFLQELAAVCQKQASDCCMGVSQAACGIYQTAAKTVVIQHWWSLNGSVWEELAVIRNVRNAECLGHTWRGIQQGETRCMGMSELRHIGWLWCPSQAKLCVTPCPGGPINHCRKTYKPATPTAATHLIENKTHCRLCIFYAFGWWSVKCESRQYCILTVNVKADDTVS